MAAADASGAVIFLDPRRASRRREVRLTAGARIDNLLLHLDG